jgi:hypothetical protein
VLWQLARRFVAWSRQKDAALGEREQGKKGAPGWTGLALQGTGLSGQPLLEEGPLDILESWRLALDRVADENESSSEELRGRARRDLLGGLPRKRSNR